MPRIYLTPAEILSMPIGIALQGQISALNPGVLDQMLARASQRCDQYCEKRLQAPSSSTLTANANAGALSISVASTLTLDNLSEQAIILDNGNSNQETVIIQSGGVNVTSWQSPYPGTITLDPSTPLAFSHNNGAAVTYCYKEVREAISASQSDPYSEALMSQAAQLALAHLPPVHIGLTRMVFLKQYPVINVLLLEHCYSFDTTYNVIFNSANPTFNGQIVVEPTAGFLRFRVGTVVLPQGFCRTTYTGGFSSIPDDIKLAVSYFIADDFQRISNPFGATDTTQGKRRQAYPMQQGRTPNVQMAESVLESYRRHI